MFRQLSIALLAVTALVPLSDAQMHGGFSRGAMRGTGHFHGARRFARGFFPGSPYFFSDYDSTEPYANEPYGNEPYMVDGSVGNAPAQFVIVQPAAADDPPQKRKPGPLLIERQGDRYVRYGGLATADGDTSAYPDYAEPAVTKPPLSAKEKERTEAQAEELPSTVLVYRDGHREEITDYAIADGVIYIRGNYWKNGYWTKRIPLAALDPSATMQANQQRGVKFLLPSAPHVVIASF